MSQSERPLGHARRAAWITVPCFAVAATLAFAGDAAAQRAAATFVRDVAPNQITFSSDVAPIINENCVVCHRPGGIGPMELTSYELVRTYAPLIADKVARGEMPPYAYDRDVGIQKLLHDWRLSPEEINTIVAWAENGAPVGDASRIPAPDIPNDEEWTFEDLYGPPDLIIPSTPIDVPADGNDMWHRPYVESGLTEDRCIRAVQVKPAGHAKTVVHHANSTFQILKEDGTYEREARVTEYAMGKIGEMVPEGVCRVAPAGAHVLWDIHLYPGGIGKTAPGASVDDNVVEIGLWFYPKDYEAPYKQDLASYQIDEGELTLAPHGTTMTQGHHVFDHPVRIDSFQPHGHLRLRHASMEIYYPETRRTEVVSMVSNWSAQWHHSHNYAPDVAPLLPAGAVLILKQWYDNTADNPNNPDPDMWVSGGSRTADEMNHAWIAITHLDEEGYEKLLEERKASQAEETEIAGAAN
jgi:mono/diheme cytochrome c family protein